MMRIIRANNRVVCRKCEGITALRDAVGKRTPFCYVAYTGMLTEETFRRYYSLISNYRFNEAEHFYQDECNKLTKRVFPTYAKAMAHLTALKLNACDEDEEYKSFKPCKIVQGYYTVSGKEVIEKTQDISDERNSVGRDDSSSGQLRQQRRINVPVYQGMGTGGWATSGSSGTTTTSSSTTTVDFDWAVANTVPNYSEWRATTGCV